jgi:hypothetical protein
LNGAEVAARGYAHPSSRCSSPAPSIVASVTSQVYHASRPASRVRRPSPMRNTSHRRARSSTPASARQSVHDAPPELPQPDSQTSESIHRGRPSTAVSFGPILPAPSKDRLRPMIGIDRYEKHKMVVVEDVINPHVFPPVTAQFMR